MATVEAPKTSSLMKSKMPLVSAPASTKPGLKTPAVTKTPLSTASKLTKPTSTAASTTTNRLASSSSNAMKKPSATVDSRPSTASSTASKRTPTASSKPVTTSTNKPSATAAATVSKKPIAADAAGASSVVAPGQAQSTATQSRKSSVSSGATANSATATTTTRKISTTAVAARKVSAAATKSELATTTKEPQPSSARRMSQATNTARLATIPDRSVPKTSLISATKRADNGVGSTRVASSRKASTVLTNGTAAVEYQNLQKRYLLMSRHLDNLKNDHALTTEALAVCIQWLRDNEQRLLASLDRSRVEIGAKIVLLDKTRTFAEAECAKIAARADLAQQEVDRLQDELANVLVLRQQELEESERRHERKIANVIEQYQTDRGKYVDESQKLQASLRTDYDQQIAQLKTELESSKLLSGLRERYDKQELELMELRNSLLRLKMENERLQEAQHSMMLASNQSVLMDGYEADSILSTVPAACSPTEAMSDHEISSSSLDSAISPNSTSESSLVLMRPPRVAPATEPRNRTCKSLCFKNTDSLPIEAISEIESLKVVLELRLEELSMLRKQNMELEVQVSHLKEIKSQLRNEEHRVEELSLLLKQRHDLERTQALQITELELQVKALSSGIKDKGLALESIQYKYLQAESRVADMMDFINSNGMSFDPEQSSSVTSSTIFSQQRPGTSHGCASFAMVNNPDDRPLSPFRPGTAGSARRPGLNSTDSVGTPKSPFMLDRRHLQVASSTEKDQQQVFFNDKTVDN